eukprot:TRINITY_DN83232_c0_g1_i1.p2 TRINITY_DN83232_c0_g1~~TRINITY_DN83232_c0_g1_i1.p2  ORF type:complete len:304 (+),score=59.10 TRINITY_DN83232_c0_g1_i1:68-913(+)
MSFLVQRRSLPMTAPASQPAFQLRHGLPPMAPVRYYTQTAPIMCAMPVFATHVAKQPVTVVAANPAPAGTRAGPAIARSVAAVPLRVAGGRRPLPSMGRPATLAPRAALPARCLYDKTLAKKPAAPPSEAVHPAAVAAIATPARRRMQMSSAPAKAKEMKEASKTEEPKMAWKSEKQTKVAVSGAEAKELRERSAAGILHTLPGEGRSTWFDNTDSATAHRRWTMPEIVMSPERKAICVKEDAVDELTKTWLRVPMEASLRDAVGAGVRPAEVSAERHVFA